MPSLRDAARHTGSSGGALGSGGSAAAGAGASSSTGMLRGSFLTSPQPPMVAARSATREPVACFHCAELQAALARLQDESEQALESNRRAEREAWDRARSAESAADELRAHLRETRLAVQLASSQTAQERERADEAERREAEARSTVTALAPTVARLEAERDLARASLRELRDALGVSEQDDAVTLLNAARRAGRLRTAEQGPAAGLVARMMGSTARAATVTRELEELRAAAQAREQEWRAREQELVEATHRAEGEMGRWREEARRVSAVVEGMRAEIQASGRGWRHVAR